MCKYHKTQFVTGFSNCYRRCADPCKSHKNVVKTSLHEVILEEFRLYFIPYKILPGQKLCFCYKNKAFVEKKQNENVGIEHGNKNEVMETNEILHETANDIVNQFVEILECSPLKVLRSDRVLSIGKRKMKDVTTKFKNVVSIVLSEPQLTENNDCSNCQRLVDSIKEKITDRSNKRKIQMLTLLHKIGQSKKQWSFSMSVNMQ